MNRNKFLGVSLVIFIIIIGTLICGCTHRVNDAIESITIKENSLKSSYEVDEVLNYDNIFILVTKQNGTSEYVNCELGMLVGFDTTTTTGAEETRQIYIEYKGVLSENYTYEVKYSTDNSKQILTSARLGLGKSEKNDSLSFNIRYYDRGLENVNTIMFTLRSANDIQILEDSTNLSFEKPNGWSISYNHSQDENTLKVIFYNKDNLVGLSDNADFIINIAGGNKAAVYSIIDTEIANIDSDGNVNRYYLPNINNI
ncbi:MAG: hypothetical protein WCR54_02330 [Clostridia bacterium]